MKLSFVIPAYNEEAYLSRCLDSILREAEGRPHDVEVLVVNNASTDRTGEIALSYPSIIVVDEPQKGIVRARQAGYRAARGDLIANIDADNMLPAGWVDRVFREFSGNDRLVALSGPLVYYDLPRLRNLETKFFYGVGYLIYLLSHFVFKRGGMLQGGNFVLRKSALDQIGGYDMDIDFYGEDTDIARRMQDAGRIKFTFRLPMYSSGRRMAEEGFFRTGLRYALNYFWILLFKRPFHTKSTDVRLDGVVR
ncbi:MAG: glycosyltransferase family 2 protein [Syntrophorhabdales bacterium]|jgi:glycosyltransferase involved in cell wall biosynthesis